MRRLPLLSCGLPCVLLLLVLSRGQAQPSPVQELRTQKVGDITYFHVRIEPPKEMLADAERPEFGFLAEPSPSLAPRLVAADGQLRLVCQRLGGLRRDRFGRPLQPGMDEPPGRRDFDRKDEKKDDGKGDRKGPRQPAPVQGIEFVGRTTATGQVKATLVYPVQGRRPKVIGRLTRRPPPVSWRETEIVLDFGKAKTVAVPSQAAERTRERKFDQPVSQPPVRDDLEGLWAVAQVDQFTGFDDEVREFGFFGFAAAAAARKYNVRGENMFSFRMGQRQRGWDGPRGGRGVIDRELFETTTGAAAIAESLQLRRMNRVRGEQENEKRTIPIGKLLGIDIAEHPWEKMMGDKKPAQEPFARMVPHDNWYVRFKGIARFIEFSELLDQWGTNLTRTYEATSRDHRLKERYQQQLCLESTQLGKTLGPLVIKGVALTGSDAYLREGTDLAILFEVTQRKFFFAAVDGYISQAKKKFGDELQQRKSDYHGVTIESYVTPLREVSLHRASVGDVVIYANSPAGIRRVIDTHQGRGKRLADSLDFQYMRTVFRADDKDEDGFAFLSDAFIRNLVGPASKIKERRRLEALTSLYMLTHAAMYTAWETGKPPATQADLMRVAALQRDDVPMPEGSPGVWDVKKQVARSDAYNTLHFATPLIELPMNDVTRTEADEYERFRLEYLGLWREFFDPIGMRVSLKEGQVKLDTYILPLIENTSYNNLRRVTGQKSVRFDPSSISNKTLAQYLMRITSDPNERPTLVNIWGGGRGGPSPIVTMVWSALAPVGDWVLLRADDGPAWQRLFELGQRAERGEQVDMEEIAKQVWSLPVALGADLRNPLTVAGTLTALRTSVQLAAPGAVTWEPLKEKYKDVAIVRVQATPGGREALGPIWRNDRGGKSKDPFLPAVYYAVIDRGFYLTLNEQTMRSLIDGAVAKRDGKAAVDVATSLYLGPKAADQTKGLLKLLLEYQTYHQARTSLPIWHALYRTGIVAADARPMQAQEAAYRYLGFVPVSPDGAAYRYDRKYDEVVNERHGSIRRPTLHRTTADDSPLNFLFEQLRSVRADLRFREDGIHTVLTLERGKAAK